MFLFSASRRAPKAFVTTKLMAKRLTDPQEEMNIFPPKKGVGFLGSGYFLGAKIPDTFTVENAGFYQWFPFIRMNLDYVYPL